MARWQQLLGALLVLLLLASLAGNALFFVEARREGRRAATLEVQVATLEGEIRTMRQQLRALPTPTPDPARLQELMDTIAEQTAELRQLDPLTPVPRHLLSQEEMGRFLAQKLEEEYPQEEAKQDAVVLATLELIPPDLDLYQMITEMLGEQVAGLYDPDEGVFYLVSFSGRLGALEKATFAHEYTHALQDQHFDLKALGFGKEKSGKDDDQLQAIQALVEGDATFTQQQYMTTYFSATEVLSLLRQSLAVDQEVLNRAPPFLRESLLFPYQEGLRFVQALYLRGGWPAVNAAYAAPPRSTEQILHPERYPEDAPQVVTLPPLTDTLGSGWHLVDENVLGEFTLRAYLDVYLPRGQAAQAAEGWDGDRYAVYQDATTDRTVLVVGILWDDVAEMTEFDEAYRAYAAERFGEATPSIEGETWVGWEGETDVLLLAQDWEAEGGPETFVVLAPDRTVAERVLQMAFSLP